MRVVICEDEKHIADAIRSRLVKRYNDLEIEIYYSGNDMISAFEMKAERGDVPLSASSHHKKREKFADIIILDVVMPGMDGFEVAKKMRDKGDGSIIIFLTGNEGQVYEAFKVEAFRYLIKPIDNDKFIEAMDAARGKLSCVTPDPERYIYIQNNGALTKIKTDSIVMAETYNRKITIHTLDSDYDYYGKMSDLLEDLGEGFFNPHRSYVINFRYVSGYDSHLIKMENGADVVMSRRKYSEFVKVYTEYIRR